MTEQKLPKIGDAVKVVTSTYVETYGLVTAVHGAGWQGDDKFHMPCINVIYVSPDASKSDSYGRQTERDLTSLQHFAEGPDKMPRPGRYYELLV